MSDELEFLKLIAVRLEAAGFRYMLSGSMALNYYAVPRMTRDLDVVIELHTRDAERFAALFAGDCYVDVAMVREATARSDMFNVIHNAWIVKADFLVRKDEPYRLAEFERRRQVAVEGVALYVVSPEDLLLSKLLWTAGRSSEVQARDVESLVSSVDSLDWEYLKTWARRLGVTLPGGPER